MRVDLKGETALVIGGDGPVRRAVAAALEANGARAELHHSWFGEGARNALEQAAGGPGRLDMLVLVGTGSEDGFPEAAARTAFDFEELCAGAAALLAGSGRIVAVASVAGLLAQRTDPIGGAVDAALYSVVRSLAMRLGRRDVRVNGLALGAIEGDGGTAGALAAGDARFLTHIPAGRAGTLPEVANALLFLVDPENTYMTGHVLVLDGGFTAGFARDF